MRQTDIRAVLELILYFALVAGITFLIIHFVGQRTVVNGVSMQPMLSDGDNLIVDKLSYPKEVSLKQPELSIPPYLPFLCNEPHFPTAELQFPHSLLPSRLSDTEPSPCHFPHGKTLPCH